MRGLDDVEEFFSHPNIGAAETAAAQGRYLIRYLVPNIREVVVFRPVSEVVNSLMAVDTSGVATYDRNSLRRGMEYSERVLRKISMDPEVLSVNYEDLNNPDICASIFEHCLPYKFDREWWETLKDKNIQNNVGAYLRYYYKNKDAIESFKSHCKSELRRLYKMEKESLKRIA